MFFFTNLRKLPRAMRSHRTMKCRRFLGVIILILVITLSISHLIRNTPKAAAQPYHSNATTPASGPIKSWGALNKTTESIMSALMSPKSLIPSAINQIQNSTSKDNTITRTNVGTTRVSDIQVILLSHQILASKDFIHIYSSNPYQITKANVIAKLPCDANLESQVNLLMGNLTSLAPVKLAIVKELSRPGYMCMYSAEIPSYERISTPHGSSPITDIVLINHTTSKIILINTSTIVIGVNEIMPLPVIR
jgi:hypothetical protein